MCGALEKVETVAVMLVETQKFITSPDTHHPKVTVSPTFPLGRRLVSAAACVPLAFLATGTSLPWS